MKPFRHTLNRLLVIVLLTAAPLLSASSLADTADNDNAATVQHGTTTALNRILGEDILQRNVQATREKAAAMPVEDCYEFLANWVLPNEDRPTFRLRGEFCPAHPAPAMHIIPASSTGSDILQAWGHLSAPALDLVNAAEELGRLNLLRERIAASTAADVQQKRCRAAMLFLADVARDDIPAAGQAFDELIELSEGNEQWSVEARWPELLALWVGVPKSKTRPIVADYLLSLYNVIVMYTADTDVDLQKDYVRMLSGLAQHLDIGNSATMSLLPQQGSEQWVAFNYASAIGRSRGRPNAQWKTNAGRALKLTGPEFDYLSFRSPLRGNYEVECDLSPNFGKTAALMTTGTHVKPLNDSELQVGGFRRDETTRVMDPPFTHFQSWYRHRAVVRDGTLTHYINGRAAFEKRLSPEHDPWVAVRTWRRSQCGVRNFRITGDPVIPAEIQLTADPELSGWAPYFTVDFGSQSGKWQPSIDNENNVELLGNRREKLRGTAAEELIRYSRPMAEDGTITYEFFYQPGEFAVYPALDRLSFLMQPGGVRIHWVTDGMHDRTALPPDNVIDEPVGRRGPAQLPLKQNAWNKLALALAGDTVTLQLNGVTVYVRDLEPANDRTFGLFHFSDRTSAKVRNVVWRGDWPKRLPFVDSHHPALSDVDLLDSSSEALPAVFRHDFRDGLPPELFDVVGDETFIHPLEYGVRTERIGNEGVDAIRASLQIHGDYDIIVSFEDLQIVMPEPKGRSGIGLQTLLENLTQDQFAVFRRNGDPGRDQRTAFSHLALQEDGKKLYDGDYLVEESTSGRLRLARRGDTVSALYAEDDSSCFRLIRKQQVAQGDVAVEGLRLLMQCGRLLVARVVWKELVVRAEQISGLPITDSKSIVAALNGRHETLPVRQIDFADVEAVDQNFFMLSAAPQLRKHDENGMRLAAVGPGVLRSATLYSRFPIGTDFDVAAEFEIHQMDSPERPNAHSEVTMQIFMQNSEPVNSAVPVEVSFLLRQKGNGVRKLIARFVGRNQAGKPTFRPIRAVHVTSPDKFRIAMFEQKIYFLYSEAGSDEDRVVAVLPVNVELMPRSCAVTTFANGNERVTDVTWKKLTCCGRTEVPVSVQLIPKEE